MALAVVLMFCRAVALAEELPPDSAAALAMLHELYEAREQSRQQFRCVYDLEEHQTFAARRAIYGPDVVLRGRDVTSTTKCILARKNGKLLTSSDGPALGPDGPIKLPKPILGAYDGTVAVVFDGAATQNTSQPLYGVSSDPAQVKLFTTPWEASGETDLLKAFSNLMAGQKGVSFRAEHDRANQVKLTIDGGATHLVAILSVDHQFAPKSIDTYFDGALTSTYRAENYSDSSGLLVPTRATYQTYDANSGQVRTRFRTTVRELSIDASAIPDEMFHVPIPEGAAIFDLATGDVVRDPILVARHLRRLTDGLTTDSRFWIVGVNCLIICLVAAYVGWRLWTRPSSQ
jgi:hypothetical protein